MRIGKHEKDRSYTRNSPAGKKDLKNRKYKPVTPVCLTPCLADAVFIRSADVCKLLNISNSTLKPARGQSYPVLKLGGTFLYSKEEIMNSRHLITAEEYEQERIFLLQSGNRPLSGHQIKRLKKKYGCDGYADTNIVLKRNLPCRRFVYPLDRKISFRLCRLLGA